MYSSLSYLFFRSVFLYTGLKPCIDFFCRKLFVLKGVFLFPKKREFVSDSSLDMSVVMMTKGHVFAVVQSDHIFLPNPVHVSFPRLVFFDCLILCLDLYL